MNLLWEVGITPRIDAYLAFYITVGCFQLMACLTEKDPPVPAMLAAAALGLAAGVKHTAIVAEAILLPALILTIILRSPSGWRKTVLSVFRISLTQT